VMSLYVRQHRVWLFGFFSNEPGFAAKQRSVCGVKGYLRADITCFGNAWILRPHSVRGTLIHFMNHAIPTSKCGRLGIPLICRKFRPPLRSTPKGKPALPEDTSSEFQCMGGA
jgi:hypothetical protein